MPYTVKLSNGSTLSTVQDGTVDGASSSLTLIGYNFPHFGTFINENMAHLLENFSNSVAPSNVIKGQIWWDSFNKILKVYDGTQWVSIARSVSSAVQPTSPNIGDTWWDSVLGQLKAWDGVVWTVIGPAFTSATGQSGALVDQITDTNSTSHIVVKFYISNDLVSILNNDAEFTPQVAIPGFATVKPGFNLTSLSTPELYYNGNASNAVKLGGVDSANYLRSDVVSTTNNKFNIANNLGISIGGNGELAMSVTGSTSNISSVVNGNNLNIGVTTGGVLTSAIQISGSSGLVTVAANPITALGVATKQYVDAISVSGVTSGMGTTVAPVDNFSSSLYRAAKYVLTVTDLTANNWQITEILVLHNGTTSKVTQYGSVYSGTSPIMTFTADLSGGNVRLLGQGVSSNNRVNWSRQIFSV